MGQEIVYCEICGDRILVHDFQKGQAITLLSKNYCVKCKEEAIRSVGIDEAIQEVPAPPPRSSSSSAHLKALKTPMPMSKAHGPTRSLKPASTAGIRAHPAPPPSSAKTGIIIGAVVGALAMIGIAAVLLSGGDPEKSAKDPDAPPRTSAAPPKPPPPVDRGAEAIRKLREMAASTDPEKLLAECRAAAEAVAGTPHAAELDAIEKKARERAEASKKRREFDKLLADVDGLPQQDPQFLRYDEAMAWISAALDHVRDFPEREPDAAQARNRYVCAFNAEADKHFEALKAKAEGFARERRYDEAVAAIQDGYPPQFKRAPAWAALEDLLIRYRAMRTEKPPKAPDSAAPGGSDGFPAVEPPAVGKSASVFDGQSMDLWHSLVQTDERDGAWKVLDGALVGESSTPNIDKNKGAADFLMLKYADVTDFELEFKMRTEGEGAVFGGRFVIRDKKALCGLTASDSKEWATYRMSFAGRSMTVTRDGIELKTQGADEMPAAGRVFFAIYAGSKAFLKDVKFLRKK